MALSFKERDGIFASVDCADWAEFKGISYRVLREIHGGGPVFESFIFRGQSCSSWGLTSSFDRRHAQAAPRTIDDRYAKVLNAFIRNYEIYGDMDRAEALFIRAAQPEEGDYEAIAQHFGMPTRLLDWTKSLYVAAFFAFSKVEECTSDLVSVWALDKAQCRKHFSEKHVVLHEDIYKENKRQLWQMGVFVSNLTERRNFADLFCAESKLYDTKLDKEAPLLLRFDIPKRAMSEAIDDLNMMRINSMTLFPGIDGVVRWIDRGGYAIDE